MTSSPTKTSSRADDELWRLRHELQRARDEAERALRRASELEAAAGEARAASRSRSERLAKRGHEMRAKVTGILGTTERAVGRAATLGMREHLASIQILSESLLANIQDILELSTIEPGADGAPARPPGATLRAPAPRETTRVAAPVLATQTADTSADQVDRDALLARLDADDRLFRDAIPHFVKETPTLLGAVRDAVAEGDGVRLARAAQTLKTNIAVFGVPNAAGAAQPLEHLGRFERTLRAATSAQATEALGRLEVCVAGMLIALSSFATGG